LIRLGLVILFFLVTSDRLLSQSNCNFQLQLDTGLVYNSKISFSRFSITGVNKKVANQLRDLITIKKDEYIFIHNDTLCKKFNSILINKSFTLTSIEVYDNCLGDESSGLFRFVYSKQ